MDGHHLSQLRLVDVGDRTLSYTLTKKRVKNLNLRLGPGGAVHVSAPWSCPAERADALVREKWSWIAARLAADVEPLPQPLEEPTAQMCRQLLYEALLRVHPLAARLGVALPELRLRALKSQWGNCHWGRRYITLNTALARCPEQLRDYVALHELVHFLHHDHGPGFYQTMTALMPDWQRRRKDLKRYGRALFEEERE